MSVKEIFESMDYGPAPESASEAKAWLAKHDGAFGHFIGGGFTPAADGFESRNPATGDLLAGLSQATEADVDAAVAAARARRNRAGPVLADPAAHVISMRLHGFCRNIHASLRCLNRSTMASRSAKRGTSTSHWHSGISTITQEWPN